MNRGHFLAANEVHHLQTAMHSAELNNVQFLYEVVESVQTVLLCRNANHAALRLISADGVLYYLATNAG